MSFNYYLTDRQHFYYTNIEDALSNSIKLIKFTKTGYGIVKVWECISNETFELESVNLNECVNLLNRSEVIEKYYLIRVDKDLEMLWYSDITKTLKVLDNEEDDEEDEKDEEDY